MEAGSSRVQHWYPVTALLKRPIYWNGLGSTPYHGPPAVIGATSGNRKLSEIRLQVTKSHYFCEQCLINLRPSPFEGQIWKMSSVQCYLQCLD